MTKIDIVSGFLGAGKTTLIKKLLAEAFPGEKLVLIENEFGEISIDGGFLKESGVQISEMSAGCICCSLVGDFHKALKDVQAQFHPDRILIEPSGVGKLSDVIVAVQNTADETDDMKLNSFVTVADEVSREYLALPDGPGRFTQNSSCSALLRILLCFDNIRIRNYHALWSFFPESSSLMSSCNGVVLQPHPCRNMDGLGCSPFARHYWGNHCLFSFPAGTKMFQFPALASNNVG